MKSVWINRLSWLVALLLLGVHAPVDAQKPEDPQFKIDEFDSLIWAFSHGLQPDPQDPDQILAFEFYIIHAFTDTKDNEVQAIPKVMEMMKAEPDLRKDPLPSVRVDLDVKRYGYTQEAQERVAREIKEARALILKYANIEQNRALWERMGSNRFANGKQEFVRVFGPGEIDALFKSEEKALLVDSEFELVSKANLLLQRLSLVPSEKKDQGIPLRPIYELIAKLCHAKSVIGLENRLSALFNGVSREKQEDILIAWQRERSQAIKGYTDGLSWTHFVAAHSLARALGKSVFDEILEGQQAVDFGESHALVHSEASIDRFTIRHLSLVESPMRGALSIPDCSTWSYPEKPLRDYSMHVFTRTNRDNKSSGHITVVLGRVRDEKVAFIDKIQNVPVAEVEIRLEAVRRSLASEGYRMALPVVMSDRDFVWISEEEEMREYLTDHMDRFAEPEVRSGFVPETNRVSSEYSRADGKHAIRFLKPLEIPEARFELQQKVEAWTTKRLNARQILGHTILNRNGTLEERNNYLLMMQGVRMLHQTSEKKLPAIHDVDPSYDDTIGGWMMDPRDDLLPLKKTALTLALQWRFVGGTDAILEKINFLKPQERVDLVNQWLDGEKFISDEAFDTLVPHLIHHPSTLNRLIKTRSSRSMLFRVLVWGTGADARLLSIAHLISNRFLHAESVSEAWNLAGLQAGVESRVMIAVVMTWRKWRADQSSLSFTDYLLRLRFHPEMNNQQAKMALRWGYQMLTEQFNRAQSCPRHSLNDEDRDFLVQVSLQNSNPAKTTFNLQMPGKVKLKPDKGIPGSVQCDQLLQLLKSVNVSP